MQKMLRLLIFMEPQVTNSFFFNYNNKVRYINCCTQLPTHSIQ
jgi:hypothetical protein